MCFSKLAENTQQAKIYFFQNGKKHITGQDSKMAENTLQVNVCFFQNDRKHTIGQYIFNDSLVKKIYMHSLEVY